jgi:hypothetical protein
MAIRPANQHQPVQVTRSPCDPSAGPLLLAAGAGHGAGFGALVPQMTARSEPGHAPGLSGLITTISQFTIVTGITILGRLYPSIAHVGSRASSGHVLSAVAWSSPSPTPPPPHSRCRWPAPGKPPLMLGSDSARPGRTLYGAALEPGGSPVPAATPELKLYGPSRHRTIVPGPSCRSAPDSCQGTDRRDCARSL